MLERFIETYGYWAVLIGTFLEGETILVLGGFAAHRGHLALRWVILAAFIGSMANDQFYFYLGRTRSSMILSRRPGWHNRIQKIHRLLERYHTALILVSRFLYGLRTVVPFVIGMSPVSFLRFLLLDTMGALVWAAAVGTGGYFFGQALGIIIGDIKRYERNAFLVILVTGSVIWLLFFLRRKRQARRTVT